MLAAVPFGATVGDTAEFMLGEVVASVVLFESNGSIDPNFEDWTANQITEIKDNVREGLAWWEDALDRQNSVHDLNFEIDFTYVDSPISTGYEPISRRSDDFAFYVEDFFDEVGLSEFDSFSNRIRQFNHAQRSEHQTNWAFTIFIVNAETDEDHRFEDDGTFSLAFAFAGGQAFVSTSERPISTIAHETAHMFWAMDEYAGSKSYFDRRGYYNTQNLNAADDHPDPSQRVRSILDIQGIGYTRDAISISGMESIGWKDSDGDGIFDVLDVPLILTGNADVDINPFDPDTLDFSFAGNGRVGTLPNLNSSGTGNDMTLNQISRIQYRTNEIDWETIQTFGVYETEIQVALSLPSSTSFVELRAVDDATGVFSNIISTEFDPDNLAIWQNPTLPNDVNGDNVVTPRDALIVINDLNENKARKLPVTGVSGGPPYLDVNGDGFVTPSDSLSIINELNGVNAAVRSIELIPEGELGSAIDNLFETWQQSSNKTIEINQTELYVNEQLASVDRKIVDYCFVFNEN